MTQTLSRMHSTPPASLVENPFFERPEGRRAWADNPYPIWTGPELEGWVALFGPAPSWYWFGQTAPPPGSPPLDIGPDADDAGYNPYAKGAKDHAGAVLRIMSGHIGGAITKLRGGRALAGKRVRISGSYRVKDLDTSDEPVGVSIWARSDKVGTGNVTLTNTRTGTGTVTAADATLTANTGVFTNVVAGDTLLFQNRIYRVASVTDSTHLEIQGTFPSSKSAVPWAVGCSAPGGTGAFAHWMSWGGIRVDIADCGNPGFIVRVNAMEDPVDVGDEWFIRSTDSLLFEPVQGWVYRTTAPTTSDAAQAGAAVVWGQAFNHPDIEYDDAFVPGITDLNAATPGNVEFIRRDDWTEDAGCKHLLTDLDQNGDSEATYQFSEVVELPAMGDFDTDIYLIVMPVRPDRIDDIDTDAAVVVYGVHVELMHRDEEDALLEKRLIGENFVRANLVKEWEAERFAQPVPMVFGIDPAGVSMNDNLYVGQLFPPRQAAPFTRLFAASGTQLRPFTLRLPELPQGSSIFKIELDLDPATVDRPQLIDAQVFSFVSASPYERPVVPFSAVMSVAVDKDTHTLSFTRSDSGGALISRARLYRNVVGLHFPLDTYDPLAPLRPSFQAIEFTPAAGTAADAELRILGGRVFVFADRRMLRPFGQYADTE